VVEAIALGRCCVVLTPSDDIPSTPSPYQRAHPHPSFPHATHPRMSSTLSFLQTLSMYPTQGGRSRLERIVQAAADTYMLAPAPPGPLLVSTEPALPWPLSASFDPFWVMCEPFKFAFQVFYLTNQLMSDAEYVPLDWVTIVSPLCNRRLMYPLALHVYHEVSWSLMKRALLLCSICVPGVECVCVGGGGGLPVSTMLKPSVCDSVFFLSHSSFELCLTLFTHLRSYWFRSLGSWWTWRIGL
jgi:hypothetical protein